MPTSLVLVTYGSMFGLALLWSLIRGDPALLQPLQQTGQSTELWVALSTGIAIGLLVVGLSHLLVKSTRFAKHLEDEFARILGPLSSLDILLLTCASAFAEEVFFRAAMQPSLGLVATSFLFGLLHVGPGLVFLPWTIMAIGMGFVLGGLFEWSGSLLPPILCHATINLLNLHRITGKYRVSDKSEPKALSQPPARNHTDEKQ